jgi:hypothetical protein
MIFRDWNSRGNLWPVAPLQYGDDPNTVPAGIPGVIAAIPGLVNQPPPPNTYPPPPPGVILPSVPVTFDMVDLLKYGAVFVVGFFFGRR